MFKRNHLLAIYNLSKPDEQVNFFHPLMLRDFPGYSVAAQFTHTTTSLQRIRQSDPFYIGLKIHLPFFELFRQSSRYKPYGSHSIFFYSFKL